LRGTARGSASGRASESVTGSGVVWPWNEEEYLPEPHFADDSIVNINIHMTIFKQTTDI